MALSPQPVSMEQFASLLHHYHFTREISAVHLHYTRYPNYRQYQGAESIAQLWRRHTQTFGLAAVAQHLTIGPDGSLWLGRNWNLPPASVAGLNGNAQHGPFMLMLIGNFDFGGDHLEDAQRTALLRVVNLVQQRFDLPPESLQLGQSLRQGSDMAQVTALDIESLHKEARTALSKEAKTAARGTAAPTPGANAGSQPGELGRIMAHFSAQEGMRSDAPDAQLPEENLVNYAADQQDGASMHSSQLLASRLAAMSFEEGRRGLFGSGLSEEIINELRPHVINLEQGHFSPDGEICSTQEDVDAIFEEHLTRALADAQASDQKLHLLFYAHGGLVDEGDALRQAARHIPWWKQNQVYPIYFIWETGLFEIIGQWIGGAMRQRQRHGEKPGFVDDFIEATARHLGGPLVWAGMKRSAERASSPGGGAHYVAQKVKAFSDAHPDQVVIHAIGHSAGAIFHNYFLPALLDMGAPPLRTVHFMAPALRVDSFHERLAGRMGNGIDEFTIFTLRRSLELIDPTIPIYNKSILYLIYYALERSRRTPLLGLEGDLRRDAALKALFGIGGNPSTQGGEVIWAQTQLEDGPSATQAKTHIDFPRDNATMNSLLRRILDKRHGEPIVGFETTPAERLLFTWDLAEFLPLPVIFGSEAGGSLATGSAPTTGSGTPLSSGGSVTTLPVSSTNGATGATTGNGTPLSDTGGSAMAHKGAQRALCVGIDHYAAAPLNGCVADARLWQQTLVKLGFESPIFLSNEQATHAAIQEQLRTLLQASKPGDVVVFQFAGHGTQLPDLDGDEAAAGFGQFDQAICPYDYEQGAFLIDDDIRAIFEQTPDDVNITCFIDCCYSGTITRVAVGPTLDGQRRGADERRRSLIPTMEMFEAHKRFRQNQSRSRSRQRARSVKRGPESMREIVFSACQPYEVAWETDGQGDFTRRAVQVLQTVGSEITHELFYQQLMTAFGEFPRQKPLLDCAPTALSRLLLQPHLAPASTASALPAPAIGS